MTKTRDPRAIGFSWLSPYLTVRDAAIALECYEKAFGFARRNTMQGPDGTIQHAEMAYQDITIMFSPEGTYGGTCKAPATSHVEVPISLYVYCADVDAITQQARQAGARVLSEPADMLWGDRMARLQDPDGYVWSFATHTTTSHSTPTKTPHG